MPVKGLQPGYDGGKRGKYGRPRTQYPVTKNAAAPGGITAQRSGKSYQAAHVADSLISMPCDTR